MSLAPKNRSQSPVTLAVFFIDLLLCINSLVQSFHERFPKLPLHSCCGRANNTLSAGALAGLSVSLTPGGSLLLWDKIEALQLGPGTPLRGAML